MSTIHVLTGWNAPKLWIWRDKAANSSVQLQYDAACTGSDAEGLKVFDVPLDHQLHEPAHGQLHAEKWEDAQHIKTFPRGANYRFPADLWIAHGAARVLAKNPFAIAQNQVRIHLITANRYRDGKLFVWSPGQTDRWIEAIGSDGDGPYFDVTLEGRDRHLFLFKFFNSAGVPEPDYANRLWSAQDGAEIWVHSQSTSISSQRPQKKSLVVHYLQLGAPSTPRLHLWQDDSDFQQDVEGTPDNQGWLRYEYPVYTGRPYGFMFFNPGAPAIWENEEARRIVFLRDNGECWTTSGDGTERKLGMSGAWTLEGDHELFAQAPVANQEIRLAVVGHSPENASLGALVLDVWVNRARANLYTGLAPDAAGQWRFKTYPEIVTSFRFRSANVLETIDRHSVKVSADSVSPVLRYVVLGRSDPLASKPVADLFSDPPFVIRRPGPWVENGYVRFALHCPSAASVEIIGDWTNWRSSPIPMRSTLDGAYWWAEVPVSDISGYNSRGTIDGALYKFVLNQIRLVQDPAADWVENSDLERASKLVDHARFPWKSNGWSRPGWEYLSIYQLHPSRFSARAGARGLAAVTREIRDPQGYLRKVNATALLLMPTCEFAGDQSWGYNPSFFYSVESSYGGPAALKELVDTCHQNGLAVLLDVVFNHAGTSDNVLWSVAPESYFDGDTEWGKMINFDHPQVIHFFEQNLVHFMTQYRIDGFRFDFTRLIRYGGTWSDHVRAPGSGGGWEFMKRLQAAVHGLDGRCLLMAEHYANEWDMTQGSGPMDTQWCDNFHDRIVDAARGWDVMGPLADALKTTQNEGGGGWQTATNFPESHDEVGNEPNRIARVGGVGQGYRRNKVAAAATLFSRGIPLWFMGAEAAEWRQFLFGADDTLPLDTYESDESARRIRTWWNRLCELRRGNARVQGPAPLRVHYAQDRMLAFSRGEGSELFVLLNFGDWSGARSLAELNLPDGEYKELLNSTWGDYRVSVEQEDETSNGGWDAVLRRDGSLNVPDYGVVVLERR